MLTTPIKCNCTDIHFLLLLRWFIRQVFISHQIQTLHFWGLSTSKLTSASNFKHYCIEHILGTLQNKTRSFYKQVLQNNIKLSGYFENLRRVRIQLHQPPPTSTFPQRGVWRRLMQSCNFSFSEQQQKGTHPRFRVVLPCSMLLKLNFDCHEPKRRQGLAECRASQQDPSPSLELQPSPAGTSLSWVCSKNIVGAHGQRNEAWETYSTGVGGTRWPATLSPSQMEKEVPKWMQLLDNPLWGSRGL